MRIDLYRELIGRNNVQWVRVHEIQQIIQFVALTCWPTIVDQPDLCYLPAWPVSLFCYPPSRLAACWAAYVAYVLRHKQILLSLAQPELGLFHLRHMHVLVATVIIPSVHCTRGNIKYTARLVGEYKFWSPVCSLWFNIDRCKFFFIRKPTSVWHFNGNFCSLQDNSQSSPV